jgi:hypothetical protein
MKNLWIKITNRLSPALRLSRERELMHQYSKDYWGQLTLARLKEMSVEDLMLKANHERTTPMGAKLIEFELSMRLARVQSAASWKSAILGGAIGAAATLGTVYLNPPQPHPAEPVAQPQTQTPPHPATRHSPATTVPAPAAAGARANAPAPTASQRSP